MSVKIRLARRGRKKRPYYHVVVADARAPRDGKYIENIGSYNPMTVPATIELDRDKAFEWLMKGAQPTDTARAILKFKGVYYRKHLQRGVEKGALTEEKAAEMYQAWIDDKESKVASRKEEVAKKREEFWKMVSGEIKPMKKAADKSAGDAFREGEEGEEAVEAATEEAPAAEEAAVVEEAAATEEAPAAEETATEEAPAAEEAAVVEDSAATEEAPAAEETATEEAPAAEETPAEEAPSAEEAESAQEEE